jgi:tagaturonate epimerase
MLSTLALTPSFGFGDRLGLSTHGHIVAVRETEFAPVFAQQSVRENTRTGRTPQQVIDAAKRAVELAGWDAPWGADADHLKDVTDLEPFVKAGYTFYTIDPGDYVDNAADSDPLAVLRSKLDGPKWGDLSSLYLSHSVPIDFINFDEENLLRAAVKYGRAIHHAATMFHRLEQLLDQFDFEVSVDETDSATSPLEHFFIASELVRLGVRFTSLAPRFIGGFEKGVDYIGDLSVLDAELAKHAAITRYFSTYKISLHSGSDKFSVYPLLVKHWGNRIHVKTAGTSYLVALKVIAAQEPSLFRAITKLALDCYMRDRISYHVSAQIRNFPPIEKIDDSDLPFSLELFDVREILHVTFGSVMQTYGEKITAVIRHNQAIYNQNLQSHFEKHLKLLAANN